MCGIAGIHGLEGLSDPEAVARRMTDAMAHRGPDATGVLRRGNTVLGHRRLSIIDLAAHSNQPFVSADGRYALAFNGEIYNYRELKAQLDWPWRTGSDTEVLLAAYVRWGADCLHRLHGMFAFAVHDAATDELFIARDRMGIKPLYWHRDDERVLFASELRALLATGLVPRRLDSDALVDHLRYQTVHAPATMVQGVRMLEAGHWLRISDQEVRTGRWYNLVTAADRSAERLPIDQVRRGEARRIDRPGH
ncbi:MAG TPA: asparagine synthetase B, partial [Flavobacteriales bacterium]|nr:asparagine synthetase B [Flavobacteriales bacterium]